MSSRPEILELARAASTYPAVLEGLPDPPDRIWVAGRIPPSPAVAIVGTRRADDAGRAFARRLALALGEAGCAIVSGGAEGIDAAAHAGALEARAATLVVQAAGLDRPFPAHHRALFARILDAGGGWISETPIGEPALPGRFLRRNRLIAALADVTVVVQAPLRSGALSTARWARRLERVVFAVPAAPWDPRGAGCVRLLDGGAQPCSGAVAVLRPLGLAPPRANRKSSRRRVEVEGDAGRMLPALGVTPRHVDELAAEAGLGAAAAQVALMELVLLGLARPEGAGFCRA